jgi:endonuclease/exonuclease/phosphatase family metal-dependent hydrolase
MFWNVENFFEARPHFNDKCNGIAKTVMLAADEFGGMPDLIGLAEVENRRVVQKLVSRTGLRRADYGIVHYDSPDRRGIDCALLYRRSRFRLVFSKPCHLPDSLGRPLPTRDILLAVLMPSEAAPVAILVNHHPSKVGKGSEGRRELAMARLLALRDSLLAEGIGRIIAIGDFNDEVTSVAGVTPAYPDGAGTIKFQGKWEKIDGCPMLEGFQAREHIFAPPHLSTRDTRFSGLKPLRTFSGPRYLGGLSDHYPIILEVWSCADLPQ